MIKFGNKISNFEIKSEIAHVNFKYVSFQAFKCYCIMELLSHCHRERHVSLQHGSPKQIPYWKAKQIRYLNLYRAEFSGSSPLHLLELFDPMQLVHSLDQKSPFKTKPKENGKCKAGNGWKEEDKAIKINASGCSLWLIKSPRCLISGTYKKGYITLYLFCFLNAFLKHILFVISIGKLLDWLNPMATFTKFKNSNKKPVQDSSLCPGSTIWPVSIPLMLFPI